MKTEYEYGREYAEFCADDNGDDGAVNIDEMVNSTIAIPGGDYHMMVSDGIENPSPRLYWKGFNSYFMDDERA